MTVDAVSASRLTNGVSRLSVTRSPLLPGPATAVRNVRRMTAPARRIVSEAQRATAPVRALQRAATAFPRTPVEHRAAAIGSIAAWLDSIREDCPTDDLRDLPTRCTTVAEHPEHTGSWWRLAHAARRFARATTHPRAQAEALAVAVCAERSARELTAEAATARRDALAILLRPVWRDYDPAPLRAAIARLQATASAAADSPGHQPGQPRPHVLERQPNAPPAGGGAGAHTRATTPTAEQRPPALVRAHP